MNGIHSRGRPMLTRRTFLRRSALALAALAAIPRRAAAREGPKHPTPRAGITGDKVLGGKDLAKVPELVPLFDGVRAIPQVVDGIGCSCGCASHPGFYSLLSCYEGDGMARGCPTCQGEGRLVVRLHGEGRSLDEIRTAIDTKFGD